MANRRLRPPPARELSIGKRISNTFGNIDRIPIESNSSIRRSDAESISTTTSQDSRGSNKENNRPEDDGVVMRKKSDYSRVRDGHITRMNYGKIY